VEADGSLTALIVTREDLLAAVNEAVKHARDRDDRPLHITDGAPGFYQIALAAGLAGCDVSAGVPGVGFKSALLVLAATGATSAAQLMQQLRVAEAATAVFHGDVGHRVFVRALGLATGLTIPVIRSLRAGLSLYDALPLHDALSLAILFFYGDWCAGTLGPRLVSDPTGELRRCVRALYRPCPDAATAAGVAAGHLPRSPPHAWGGKLPREVGQGRAGRAEPSGQALADCASRGRGPLQRAGDRRPLSRCTPRR
jgi:hypothetical protein